MPDNMLMPTIMMIVTMTAALIVYACFEDRYNRKHLGKQSDHE